MTVSIAGSVLPGASTTAQTAETSAVQKDVIVILRDQLPNVPPMRHAMEARAAAVAAAQGSVVSRLQRSRGRSVHTFGTINAFSTRVTADEATQLTADPAVLAVVPDAIIKASRRSTSVIASNAVGNSPSASSSPSGLCGTLEPEALQLTNTAFLDPNTPQAQQVRDGNGKTVTGKGVKVAFIADGLDPNIAGFIRPDGSHVFIDYQDFSGDPAGTPSPAAEAFGDASSIAAQDNPHGTPLLFDISKFVNAAHPLPSPCNIHIRGMAPDASLVGLKVFSNVGYTTTSDFVQAIEWAVTHDDVDVINESFGGAPLPDTANDPTSLANAAAVRAGVTVVVSTGDAGTAGTLGSPSTDPNVIAVGASTQYRLYAQTGYGVQALATGVVDNNISSFSSGGFAQNIPRTVDVVAPGDLGWALCSTNTTLYTECINFGSPAVATPVQDFGGTSESSPLTAGEAALIIQAYRSTHRGQDPTPATVKQIIMSTATDLGAPAFEQGAGLINSLAAVNAALSLDDHNGRPKNQGNSLLTQPSSAAVESTPNSRQDVSFSVTNTGTTTRHLSPTLQELGAPIAGNTITVTLNPSTDPTFLNPSGAPRAYVKRTFAVPAGAQHLDAAIAFKTPVGSTNPPIAYISLLDPSGRQAAYSIPQGLGSGYGHVDIVSPAAGTWTAIIWTRVPGAGSYAGPVQFSWAAENYVTVGSVSPSHLDLAPGASGTLTANFSMPSASGDSSAAIRLGDSSGISVSEIPVTLRTLIPIGHSGGSFAGTLTGGNGRPGQGPTQSFDFDVPYGVKNMSLALEIADSGYLLEGLLVDPTGMQLSVEPNLDPASGDTQNSMQLYREYPRAGRWKFVLVQNFTSSGNQTSLPFSARISFNGAVVAESTMFNNRFNSISASGGPVTVQVHVTNTSAVTEAYFADARLDSLTVASLQPLSCSPPTLPGNCGAFYVPTQVSRVQFLAQSTAPITMDAYNDVGYGVGFTGSPDLYAKQVGTDTVAASLNVPEVPYGLWIVVPSLVGPYGPGGAPTTPVASAASVQMQPFDAMVSADSGDIWADVTLGTNTYNPLVLSPGQMGTINLTVTPDPTQVGKTVKGFLYIDTFNGNVQTGDEVVRLPYTYTITR